MTTEYEALLGRLFAARRAGIVLGLERVQAVCERLGHPERRLGRVVHVGGTNGKGSTAAMIAMLARYAGARVGLYTSPHLASLRERFVVDGAAASEADTVAAAEAVAAAGGDALTFFEQVTLIGFELFARAAVDVSVVEVGLGGRLDATNVVDPEVAVVTGVAMDHEAMLGPTLAAIAGEKAGIWKAGRHAVIGMAGEPEAVPWLRDAAEAAGAASVRLVGDADVARTPVPGLLGDHQRANAACACVAVEVMGLEIEPDVKEVALRRVEHPGRMEVVADRPVVMLDGAHNPHGAAALARYVARRSERPRVLVLAVSSDKDVRAMVAAMIGGGAFERVVVTRYAQARAMEPGELAEVVRGEGEGEGERERSAGMVTVVESGLREAMEKARESAGEEGLVVVAGSLYAVGEVRPWWTEMAVDPIVVSDPAPRA